MRRQRPGYTQVLQFNHTRAIAMSLSIIPGQRARFSLFVPNHVLMCSAVFTNDGKQFTLPS